MKQIDSSFLFIYRVTSFIAIKSFGNKNTFLYPQELDNTMLFLSYILRKLVP